MISHTLSDNYILQNRYHIIRLIGQGGFGLTYLATDTELNKKVCIKELFIDGINQRTAETVTLTQGKTNFPWQHFIANFKKEAQKIAEFKHPNIVSVSSVFEANGTVYYVMDYVEGETLKDRLKTMGRPFNPEELKPIAAQIFDAVETVHQKGLLHRDIKPDNILITSDDKIVLIDFGSARENMDEKTVALLSATTMIFLTHGYAAPEMYSNTVLKGKYTDIYSLGATFYFLLTAVKPTAANDLILGAKMPNVHELNTNVSTQISSVIGLAMQLKPEDRFQMVSEFRAALKNLKTDKGDNTVKVPEKKPDEKTEADKIIEELFGENYIYVLYVLMFFLFISIIIFIGVYNKSILEFLSN
jgi:serine/threonine protein kinase